MDYMEDMPGGDALMRFVREHVGEGHGALDASRVWNIRWMKHLADFDMVLFKLFGDNLVQAMYDNDIGFRGSGVASLSFDGLPLALFKRYLGTMEGDHYWLFYPEGGEDKARKFVYELLKRERDAKELYIWGSREVPLDKLDTTNFVNPRYVQDIFAREVYPQMEDKEIFNHVLLVSSPGVGKTAFCRVLAKKYPEWQTVVVAPHVIDKPISIQHAFDYAIYRTPAILILEDIDTWGQTRFEETSMKEDFSPYLGALLNCVDGIDTNQELLVLATTNNPQVLDPAIVRPGRFGVMVEFRYTMEELVTICNNYLGEEHAAEFYKSIIRNTPAHLRAVMKTAKAFSKLNGTAIDQAFLKEINTMLKKEPKLPRPEDMFIGTQDQAESSPEYR
ncbi:MAG: ATP-binding protein [Thermoplasmata archaeon]